MTGEKRGAARRAALQLFRCKFAKGRQTDKLDAPRLLPETQYL